MTERRRLPSRRASVTVSFKHSIVGGKPTEFKLTVGFFEDETPGEIFVNTSQRAGSEADMNASDAAVLASLALQYGCPLEILCAAVKRNPDGSPTGPIGRALDEVKDIAELSR